MRQPRISVRGTPALRGWPTLLAGASLAAGLAACSAPSPPSAGDLHAKQPLAQGDGRIEWRGSLACADCDGIQTQLVLQRTGRASDYRLTETYLAAGQGDRFVEHGRWRRDADLLRLQGDGGSRRTFALLADGRLQPRDGHGMALTPREDDFLEPVTVADAP